MKNINNSLKELTNVNFSKLISHLPILFDVIFTIICRAPDIFNNFLKENEKKSGIF
jgi:hypothetical protein